MMDKTVKLFLTYIFFTIIFALVFVLFVSYFYLYGSAIEREKAMLLTVVSSNSKMIEAVAKFDAKFSQTDDPGGSEGATLSQINEYVSQFSKVNPNYTIQVIKLVNSDIKVISFSLNKNHHFSSEWYSANNKLLLSVINGSSGTVICDGGLHNELIIAYSKIDVLNYGMLVSVNLDDIKKPYLRSLWIGILSCFIIALFFGSIIRRKAQPIVDKLQSEKEKTESALETLKKNEERLEIALSVNNDGIFDLDSDGAVAFFDERFYTIAGYSVGDFPSEFNEWKKRIHPEDLERVESEFKNYLEGKTESFDVEYQFKKKDNSWMWLRSRVKVVNRSSSLKAQRVIGTNTDITERKFAEIELRQNEENLKVTLNSIGDAVITTDINGCITRMNPIAEKLTGWKLSDAYGQALTTVFDIINSVTRERVSNPVDKVISTGEIVGLANHTMLISKNGKEYHIADSGAPIMTRKGLIIGVVLVFRDVTDDYALQSQLRHSQKMDAIGQLAGGIAHDFNNMLGGILMSAGLLKKYIIDKPDAQRPLNLIYESAKHAASLTKKLLTFSRKENYATQQIELHSVILDTVSLLETTIDKLIDLKLDLNAESSCILGDPSMLQSCILNLGINASHAMPNGGKITFRTQIVQLNEEYCEKSVFDINPGSFIQLDVEDTGFGISSENLNKIFEPFFTTKPQGKGTGLGLSAVYGSIQQHQGAINVSSLIDKGTTFQILLPLYTGKTDSFENGAKYIPKKGEGLILFVDDELVFRETAKPALEGLGYEVLVAANGKDALNIYEKSFYKIDLVVLDMMMPIMNGLDCFIELKKINPKVKVLLASGFIKNADLEQIKKEGIKGFIKKPYNAEELFQEIEIIMQNE